MAVVLDHVRRLAAPSEPADVDLLRLFVTERDQKAFETLVLRHGPLVYGLCRRLLNDSHAAEDVFQATFLVLARKAGSIRKQALLGSWLYGVTTRLALNARRKTERRRRHEVSAADLPTDPATLPDRKTENNAMATDPVAVLGAAEVRTVLEEELAQLPDRYRAPLLLCGCAGKKTADAARDLGCPEPTLKSRLRRGRELLRSRLARRGFMVSAPATAALLHEAAAGAAVPPALLAATARAALPFVAGQAVAGVGSAGAVALAAGLLRGNALRRLAVGLIAVFPLVLCGAVAALLGWQADDGGSKETGSPRDTSKSGVPAVDRHGDTLPPGALARLGSVRWRHGGRVWLAAFMSDGKQLLSAGADGRARLWDVATGKEAMHFQLTRHDYADTVALALSADGHTVASCVRGEPVRVWDVRTGKEARPPKGLPPRADLLALDHAGKLLAVYEPDGSLGLWDLRSGRRTRELRSADKDADENMPIGLGKMTFSPNGKLLAVARLEARRDEPPRSVVRVWETAGGKERLTIVGPKQSNGAFAPTFTPDGQLLGWSSTDGVVHLVETATGEEARHLPAGATLFAIAPDGKRIVTRSDFSGEVAVWELATGKKLRTFSPPADSAGIAAWGFAGVVQGLSISPDGRHLVLAGEGCAVCLLDLNTGHTGNVADGHRATVSALTYLAGGTEIASRGNDGTIRIWEATTGILKRKLKVPRDAMTYVLSPDGSSIATTGLDNVVRIWDVGSGKERHELPGGSNGLVLFDFAPDGRTLAVTDAGDWSLRLYDVTNGRQTLSLSLKGRGDPPQNGVLWAGSSRPIFAPNGRLVAACVPELAIVAWDASTGREVLRVQAPRGGRPAPTAACFSPDARTLAVEWDNGSIGIWELAGGQARTRFGAAEGKKADARPAPAVGGQGSFIGPASFRAGSDALAFSPTGRFLAQVRGRTVRLWDVMTRKEMGQLNGHVGEIAALVYAADGGTLITGSADGTGLIWDAAKLTEPAIRAATTASADALATAWQALAGVDAARAYGGMAAMVAAPRQSVQFLRERLKAVAGPNHKQLAAWIAELDSDKFSVRRNAARSIRNFGRPAGPALRKVLAGSPSVEIRERINALLADLDRAKPTGEELRAGRAIEILEMIATTGARDVVRALAGGAPGAPATEAAKAALSRLGKSH
jgi:RNA polymerase sigma factor (sigma-70 family)